MSLGTDKPYRWSPTGYDTEHCVYF